VFWDVHDPAKAIGLDLRDEHYTKLVVQVDNPEEHIGKVGEATQVAS
jgi:hypothetical protein